MPREPMNSGKPVFTYVTFDSSGEEVTISLPAKFEVCHRCRGEGSHTNPSIDGNGITASEMDELGDDFREDYMRGVYDVTCSVCHGARVVAVPDRARWTAAQKRAYAKHEREEEQNDREYASEAHLRRMEAGGY
jgi:hypothetical protein